MILAKASLEVLVILTKALLTEAVQILTKALLEVPTKAVSEILTKAVLKRH